MSDAYYVPPPPPPPVLPPQPPPGPPQFDFARPFTFVFDDPDWLRKILFGGLAYLASFLLIGLPFLFGYVARVARNVVRGDERPLPDWNDLGGFFADGLRLVGVFFVYIIPFIALAIVFVVPMGIIEAVSVDASEHVAPIWGVCLACFAFPLGMAFLLFFPASLLFAAVEERFGAAFEFGRIWGFIKANIGNYLLAVVIYLIARFLGGFGFILFCVGIVFTAFWALLITAHAFAQAYRLDSAR